MKTTLAIIWLTVFTACIRTGQSEGDLATSDSDAGNEPVSRRRQRVDAGPTGPGTFRFTVSGESFARQPYPFPPARAGDPTFVDGWEVRIDHALVTIDNIALWENPDLSASDPTQVGSKVAQVSGPWIVDLHLPGASLPDGGMPDGGASDGGGSDGGSVDPPIVIATLGDQNLAGHLPFDPTKRYAISFDVVRPSRTNPPRAINLDSAGQGELSAVYSNGYSLYFWGVATWRASEDSCVSTDPSFDWRPAPPVDGGTVPREVTFKIGFQTGTTYMNCQNPDFPGPGIGGEAHPRGVKATSEAETAVQLTLRMDQPFWENSDGADAGLHFDQFAVAARRLLTRYQLQPLEARVRDGGIVDQNYTAFAVPWRWCRGDLTGYRPPDQLTRMDFEGGLYYDPSLPDQRLSSSTHYRDYYDLASHIQSGQGYLGARGHCAVQRHFPSRP